MSGEFWALSVEILVFPDQSVTRSHLLGFLCSLEVMSQILAFASPIWSTAHYFSCTLELRPDEGENSSGLSVLRRHSLCLPPARSWRRQISVFTSTVSSNARNFHKLLTLGRLRLKFHLVHLYFSVIPSICLVYELIAAQMLRAFEGEQCRMPFTFTYYGPKSAGPKRGRNLTSRAVDKSEPYGEGRQQCYRLKSSMLFKRGPWKFTFLKTAFTTQPQIENKEVTWSPQHNMPVKQCSYENWSVRFHSSLEGGDSRVVTPSLCYHLRPWTCNLLKSPQMPLSPSLPLVLSSSPHTLTLRDMLYRFVLVAIQMHQISGFQSYLLHPSRERTGKHARGLDNQEPIYLAANARIEIEI